MCSRSMSSRVCWPTWDGDRASSFIGSSVSVSDHSDNRRYAFDSFTGTSDAPPFRDEEGNIVPVNIPMGAFLTGS